MSVLAAVAQFGGLSALGVLLWFLVDYIAGHRVRDALARWRARRACLDRIEGCTRRDRHYHPGSGVAP